MAMPHEIEPPERPEQSDDIGRIYRVAWLTDMRSRLRHAKALDKISIAEAKARNLNRSNLYVIGDPNATPLEDVDSILLTVGGKPLSSQQILEPYFRIFTVPDLDDDAPLVTAWVEKRERSGRITMFEFTTDYVLTFDPDKSEEADGNLWVVSLEDVQHFVRSMEGFGLAPQKVDAHII